MLAAPASVRCLSTGLWVQPKIVARIARHGLAGEEPTARHVGARATARALRTASRGLDRMAHGLAACAVVRVEHALAPREHRVVRLEQGGRADALGHHEEAEHDDVGVQRRLAAQERLLAERGAQRLQRGAEGGQLAGALALRADLRGQEGQPRRASALPGLPALPVRECRPMA